MELCDFVICELCLERFKCITNTHLRYKHDTDIDRYKEMFPKAKIKSEKILYEMSLRSKEMWSNPEKRKQLIEEIKKATNIPEVKEHRSNIQKKRWAMEDSLYRTDEFRKKQSESAKRLHQDPEFKKKHSKAIKKVLDDWRIRYKMSYARKSLWDDPRHVYNSPEYRKKLSDSKKKGH